MRLRSRSCKPCRTRHKSQAWPCSICCRGFIKNQKVGCGQPMTRGRFPLHYLFLVPDRGQKHSKAPIVFINGRNASSAATCSSTVSHPLSTKLLGKRGRHIAILTPWWPTNPICRAIKRLLYITTLHIRVLVPFK